MKLADLEAMPEDERMQHVLPVETLLNKHTTVTLDGENAGRFLSGLRRRGDWPESDAVAVFGEEPRALLGVGHVTGGELVPDRLLSPIEIQHILESTPSATDAGILETP